MSMEKTWLVKYYKRFNRTIYKQGYVVVGVALINASTEEEAGKKLLGLKGTAPAGSEGERTTEIIKVETSSDNMLDLFKVDFFNGELHHTS